jgi:aspartokinase-like uncharacterized kinase
MTLPVRVVKLGGSLFDWPPLPNALRMWLAAQTTALNVLIAGGGALVEAIREADRAFGLGEETSHELSLHAMHATARLAAALWPESERTDSLDRVRAKASRGAATLLILDAAAALAAAERRSPGPLPRSWQVTSDSIAAWAASETAAAELVLLKSTLPGAPASLAAAAELGIVDPHLPAAAAAIPRLRFVNLRGKGFPEAAPDLQVFGGNR